MASDNEADPHGANWLLLLLLVFGGVYLFSRQGAAVPYMGSGGCGGCITPRPGGTATGTAPATTAYTGAAAAVCNMGATFPMNVSAAGIAFTKQNEGLTLKVIGDANGLEVGYGHKVKPSDGLVMGQTIDQATADAFFAQDQAWVVDCINTNVRVPLSQPQFDALFDFVYNIGCPYFQTSTLLAKLNKCDYAGAQAQFGQWMHSGGQVIVGLVARRQADAQMFGQGATATAPQTITATPRTQTSTGTATA